MAHEIDQSNNRDNMAYVGQTPWHGLGQALTPGAPLEVWMKEAGFEWEVLRAPATFTPEGSSDIIQVPRRQVLYRSDTGAPLGVVAPKFKPVQPREVLEFYRDLTETAGWQLETAGMLKGGSMYWALAKTGMELRLKGQDLLHNYLLLATANDGTMATQAMLTSIRVVCWNTLSFAVADAENNQQRPYVRVPHAATFDAEAVKVELGLAEPSWAKFGEQAEAMAARKVSRKDAIAYFAELLYPDHEELDLDKAGPRLKQMLDIYDNGVGQNTRSAKGTAWGLVNAVTRYADHERKAEPDMRIKSAWFGDTRRLKDRAFEQAMKIAA